MPTVLRVMGQEVDLVPFVEEAVRHLGYVEPGSVRWLAGEIAVHGNRNNGRSIREAGTRLTKEERLARGVSAVGEPLSAEVWNALTERGRRDPVLRFDNTCRRALKGARDVLQRERDFRVLRQPHSIFVGAKFSGAVTDRCDAAAALDGIVFPEPPVLPLKGCDREACGCCWRLITKREMNN